MDGDTSVRRGTGNLILFASLTAFEVGTLAIQSTASAEALPKTPPGDELLTAFNLPLRIRPKSISQEPRPCSVNSRPAENEYLSEIIRADPAQRDDSAVPAVPHSEVSGPD
jgi:hypothetical protein